MQCFQLPTAISNNIDRVSREFFWKKFNFEKGLPLVAWIRCVGLRIMGDWACKKLQQLTRPFNVISMENIHQAR